jgi:heat shock protein HslJ
MFWTTPDSEGTYEIKVTVDDGNGGVAVKSEKVNVKQEETSPEPPELEITDNIWQWEKFISGDGTEEITVVNPEQYMLFLESDGNMYILADCNNGFGSYVLDKNSLLLDIERITRVICEAGSMSDEYVSYITDVTGYYIEDEELFLELEEDKGTMVFGMIELLK